MNNRKFVFDWDVQDDTFSKDSPVAAGSNQQGVQAMFGRGHLTGMDDGQGSGPRKILHGVPVDAHLADHMEHRKVTKAGLDGFQCQNHARLHPMVCTHHHCTIHTPIGNHGREYLSGRHLKRMTY